MAMIVEEFIPYIIEANLVLSIACFNESPFYDKLVVLISEGLLVTNSTFYISFDQEENAIVNCGTNQEIRFRAEIGKRYAFSGYLLTKLGKEIFTLVHGTQVREKEQEFSDRLKAVIGSDFAIVNKI